MKNFGIFLLIVLGISVAAVILYVLAFIVYFLFNIFLYILPLLVMTAIILSLPYLAYQFFKGFSS